MVITDTPCDTFVAWKETTAVEVANAMAKHLILTDQGTNFKRALIESLAKCLKIKQLKITMYHPQSNDFLEWMPIIYDNLLQLKKAGTNG